MPLLRHFGYKMINADGVYHGRFDS